jgi:uncharacterized FlgJ-related protein
MGAKKASKKESNVARWEEDQRQERIRDGTNRVGSIFDSNFTPDFFTGRKQSFLDYANPQLEDQRSAAEKELTYSLARSGTLDSSIRANKFAELQKLYDTNKQQIADKALSYETDARNNVESARSNLITTLNATGDAEGAANSSLSRAAALSAPEAFSPLSQLFASFTSALGTQAAQERAQAASGGSYKAKYDTGLFGNGSNSVKVI